MPSQPSAALAARRPSVTLWTVQPRRVFEAWRKEGIYRTDPAQVDPHLLRAYDWMVEQMLQRLPPPPPGCQLPVWAWFQARDSRRKRPDLRSAAHLPPGEQGVMLTIKLDPRLVLLSDFDLWHIVLFDGDLLPNRAGGDGPARPASRRRRSWKRIFDLDYHGPGIAEPRDSKIIQAVFWQLTLDQVVEVKPFTAR